MIPDFILHERTIHSVENFIQQPAQAVLITGKPGTGLTTIARYIAAKLLNTEPATLDGDEYFRQITPEKSVITIDQVRIAQRFTRLKVPGTAGVSRVVLFDDAHVLHPAAQNALLKLLEEPPTGVVLLLVSSQPDLLLQTVRSRLGTVTITTPPKDDVIRYFVGKGNDATMVARQYMASNSSIAAMKSALADDSQDFALNEVRQLLSADTYGRLLQLDKLAKDKVAASTIVSLLAEVAAASMEQAARDGKSTVERWRSILAAVYEAAEALNKNGNTKLVLTDLALSL